MEATEQISHLTAKLNEFIRQNIGRSELLNPAGQSPLSDTQAHILMLLWNSKLPLANNQLATMMEISRPAITKAMKELTKQAYVTAQPAEHDRRVMQYQLTDRGQQSAAKHRALHAQTEADLTAVTAKYSAHDLAVITTFLDELVMHTTAQHK